MILTNKTYDALKWVALVALPALSVFYMALATTWNLPNPIEITATIAAIDTLLATLLGVSTSNYKVKAASLGFDLTRKFGSPEKGWILSKITYDVLSWVAQVFLPALASLYYALAGVWNLPFADQVVSSIMALDTFLGMILSFSSAQFHKQVAIEHVGHPAGMDPVIQ